MHIIILDVFGKIGLNEASQIWIDQGIIHFGIHLPLEYLQKTYAPMLAFELPSPIRHLIYDNPFHFCLRQLQLKSKLLFSPKAKI